MRDTILTLEDQRQALLLLTAYFSFKGQSETWLSFSKMCIRDRHTTATDKDGNKELEAGKEVTIIDTVTLEGLEVGTQYKLVGLSLIHIYVDGGFWRRKVRIN